MGGATGLADPLPYFDSKGSSCILDLWGRGPKTKMASNTQQLESEKVSVVDYYFLDGFFQSDLSDKYSCPICLSPVQREAFLTECCGKHFCFRCISRMVGTKPCPMCKAHPLVIFPNKERQREIKELSVCCPVSCKHQDVEVESSDESVDQTKKDQDMQTALMCKWIGKLSQVDAHLVEVHKEDKRWKVCCDLESLSSQQRPDGAQRKVCVFHLNQRLQEMNIGSEQHHHHHHHQIMVVPSSPEFLTTSMNPNPPTVSHYQGTNPATSPVHSQQSHSSSTQSSPLGASSTQTSSFSGQNEYTSCQYSVEISEPEATLSDSSHTTGVDGHARQDSQEAASEQVIAAQHATNMPTLAPQNSASHGTHGNVTSQSASSQPYEPPPSPPEQAQHPYHHHRGHHHHHHRHHHHRPPFGPPPHAPHVAEYGPFFQPGPRFWRGPGPRGHFHHPRHHHGHPGHHHGHPGHHHGHPGHHHGQHHHGCHNE